MQVNITQENWAGGELSPKMRGRYSLPIYGTGSERLVNFISEISGPARYRSGTTFVMNTRRNNKAVLLPFNFNDSQVYLLEFTDGYIRFFTDNGILISSTKTIDAVTQANPGVITSAAHGFSDGDEILISGVVGMTELNNRSFIVTNSSVNNFQIYDNDGLGIDTTAYTAYVSGGTMEKVLEITSPYVEADLYALKFAQNADVMYIVHRSYEPRKLTRVAATNWTLSTFTRTGDPFTGTDLWPGAICFYQGRLIYGGSNNFPESFWGSKPLDTSGNPQYDDLTVGATATDAFKFTLSPITGKVDKILSLVPTLNFLAICTFEGISKADGGNNGDPITPSNINVVPVVTQGVLQEVTPILLGINLVFFHRSGRIMYSLEYDIFYNSYNAADKTFTNDHMTESGIVQMVYQVGRPTAFWMVRNDGVLVGATYMAKENVNGWHRHPLGGNKSKTLSVGIMPRASKFDQLWVVAERILDCKIRRSVEYFNDDPIIPEKTDYYTSDANAADDDDTWRRAMLKAQRDYIHVDSALTYDNPLDITGVSATTPVVITSPAHGLSNGDLIKLDDIVEIPELNGRIFQVGDVTTDTFTLNEED
jgi:hypothetical protein